MSFSVNLTIDMGNTSTKVLVFEKNAVVFRKVYKSFDMKAVRVLLDKFKPDSAIICSVVKTPSRLHTYLHRNTNLIELNNETLIPVKMMYDTPETLGPDRLAGIIGASELFPKRNVLVIDLGTCIKYDFLTAGKRYLGGSISPGLHMRLKALHYYTDRLPLLKPSEIKGFIGKSTKESILTGVQVGMLAEIEGFIMRYKKVHSHIKIILTGGDAPRFAEQLKIPIFAAPDLVGTGLNKILNFNA